MTTVSVITPSYNQGKFIERTVQSVLSQNIPLDYVVVDGGSQDETLSILKRYEGVLRYVSEPDHGQAHAVNKGIAMTSGEIIGWLNSDDIYYPNAIQTVITYFESHPEVDILYGQADHIDAEDQLIEHYPIEHWDIERLKQVCFISQPAVFFRRRVVERYGLLDEHLHYCLDYEYWMRVALKGAVLAYLPVILAGSRLYPETKTLSAPDKAQLEAIAMLRKHLNYLPIGWVIQRAVTLVKNKTGWKKPQWRFIVAVALTSAALGFKYNGLVKGLTALFNLPKGMLALSVRATKIIHDSQTQ